MSTLKLIVCLSLAAVAAPALAASPKTEKAGKKIDPEAIEALEHMGAFLRSQQAFEVKSDSETEAILDDGQKVQLESKVKLSVQRPDKLHMEVSSDWKDREFVYDGKTLTMYGKRVGYYGTIAAPPRLVELADVLTKRYGIELPLTDLFMWGTERDESDKLTSALVVGPAVIGGKECDHYAFRQPGLDWQVWIKNGDEPLPLKVVLTTTTQEARPEYTMRLDWQLSPRFPTNAFTFQPPKGARQIEIVDLAAPKHVN